MRNNRENHSSDRGVRKTCPSTDKVELLTTILIVESLMENTPISQAQQAQLKNLVNVEDIPDLAMQESITFCDSIDPTIALLGIIQNSTSNAILKIAIPVVISALSIFKDKYCK